MRATTPESLFISRRQAIKALGVASAGALFSTTYAKHLYAGASVQETYRKLKAIKAKRNGRYPVSVPFTPREIAAQYNNFYEFGTQKDIWESAQALTVSPWQVKVDGLVHKPRVFDIDDLRKGMPIEERAYRFRCVEAWSMVVPWTGFPLSALLKQVEPLSKAKYVMFRTFLRPHEAPRQKQAKGGFFSFPSKEEWPYQEGITLKEAMNELSLLATGIYGHDLPKQHGAPIRLVLPWKYGYKNIKSIVHIRLVEKQPTTFWNQIAPNEYGFTSNVDPSKPHPRWSQAFERDIGTRKRIPTRYLNGYEQFVGKLYT